jgi:acyl-CoA dehydrogenase
MEFALSEEHQMLKDLVRRFVDDQLIPLERTVLAREAAGGGNIVTPEEREIIDKKSRELGLWGLDAPVEFGGSDLPTVAMIGVNEEIGKTVTPYTLPPDSPNLRMLMATVNDEQRALYLEPMRVAKRFRRLVFPSPARAAIRPR